MTPSEYLPEISVSSSAISILNTAFPLYSPIATINFKKTGAGRSVVVSGEQCEMMFSK